MNTHHTNPYAAYQRTQQSAMSIRQMEQAVMTRAIGELDAAAANVNDHEAYVAALTYNQKLWSAIQINMIEDNEGRIPDLTRARLLKLSVYVDRQTVKALSAPAPEQLAPLIEINKTLAGGLFALPEPPDAPRQDEVAAEPSGSVDILPPSRARAETRNDAPLPRPAPTFIPSR